MSTYAFHYSYDAAGNRVKQVKDGVATYYHYDEANELLMSHEYGSPNTFHFFEYDANGSMEHDSKVETAANVLLDCEYEGTTDGADGEQATESGTITYGSGELPGTEAVRVAVDGGSTGTISYGATGNLADGEGTVLLRVKNDDWDSGSHTTQYLLELWLDATHYIRIWLDASAGVLHADGKDANKTWALEADASEWLDGSWYDIVLAYATRDERLYVNGVQEDSDTAKDMPTGLTDIYVGADQGGSNHWYGLVDEFLTFDSALTATEIANLSNRTGGASNTTYFEYADNGLTSRITPPTGSPTQFYYDARMQRHCIDWAGTVNYYAWDGLNQIVEKDASLSTIAQHTHGQTPIEGIGSVAVTKRSSDYQYPHYDHRGSLFELEDTGAEDLDAEYNAFGEELSRTGAAVTRFGYQGTAWWRLVFPDGTPLMVSPSRTYQPCTGTFGQRDMVDSFLLRLRGSWGIPVEPLPLTVERRSKRSPTNAAILSMWRMQLDSQAALIDKRLASAIPICLSTHLRERVQRVRRRVQRAQNGIWRRKAMPWLRPGARQLGPAAATQCFSTYLYCRGDPLRGVDPTGLESFSECWCKCMKDLLDLGPVGPPAPLGPVLQLASATGRPTVGAGTVTVSDWVDMVIPLAGELFKAGICALLCVPEGPDPEPPDTSSATARNAVGEAEYVMEVAQSAFDKMQRNEALSDTEQMISEEIEGTIGEGLIETRLVRPRMQGR